MAKIPKILICKGCKSKDPQRLGLFCIKYDKYCRAVRDCAKRNNNYVKMERRKKDEYSGNGKRL